MEQSAPFYVVGNWKSNKTVSEAVVWFQDFEALWKKNPVDPRKVKVILCPGFIHLTTLHSLIELAKIPLALGTQNISPFPNGAYTGEISSFMIKDMAVFTLIGHSERRKHFGEDEKILAEKVSRAKEAGLEPIYCVQDEHAAIPESCTFVAYEPVWAVGTGKPDTADNANRVAKALKSLAKTPITIIYGGSVTADNVTSYVQTTDIGGVLPGGASLTAQAFHGLIIHAAESTV